MLSTSPLLISGNGYTRYMMEAFPIVRDTSTPSLSPYKELAQVEMKELINQYALSDIPEVCLTDDYVSEELPSCSIFLVLSLPLAGGGLIASNWNSIC